MRRLWRWLVGLLRARARPSLFDLAFQAHQTVNSTEFFGMAPGSLRILGVRGTRDIATGRWQIECDVARVSSTVTVADQTRREAMTFLVYREFDFNLLLPFNPVWRYQEWWQACNSFVTAESRGDLEPGQAVYWNNDGTVSAFPSDDYGPLLPYPGWSLSCPAPEPSEPMTTDELRRLLSGPGDGAETEIPRFTSEGGIAS